MRRPVIALFAVVPISAFAACGGLTVPEAQVTASGDGGAKCATPAPGCSCVPAYWTRQSCYSGPAETLNRGRCRPGHMKCSDDGILSACEGEVLPTTETCNGLDDDCNGLVDDLPDIVDGGVLDASLPDGSLPASIAALPVQCLTGRPGLCAFGHNACTDAGLACVPNVGTYGLPETCNGVDDDCNGVVDDGITNAGACTLPDPNLKGECKKGALVCVNAATVCSTVNTPKAETCNGLDDDCDGTVDNGSLCPPCYGCYGASGCLYTCSCPYVFAWDGTAFRYETTVGGASLVGRREHLDEGRKIDFVPMWIRLDRAAIDFRGDVGRARAKILAADDEIAYLDHARLTVVHHPEGTEIFSTTSMQWNTVERPDPRALFALRTAALRAPARAAWMGETDVTRALSVRDDRAAAHDETLANFYELDFGPVTDTRHARLVIEGWKIKKVRNLREGVAQEPPRLEVQDADGTWRKVMNVGTPRGDRKAVVVDLAGVELPSGRYRFRLWTGTHEGGLAMWYLDRVRLTEEAPARIRSIDIEPARADLGFSGTPSVRDPHDNTHPLDVVDDGKGELPAEHRTWGRFTRYGDVRELVARSDDRLVVMRRGDGLELAFDGIARPRAGETVSLLLDVSLVFKPRKWIEDGRTTPTTQAVGPLPYRGMGHYPPPRPRAEDERYAAYLREWQTREYLEGDPRWGT